MSPSESAIPASEPQRRAGLPGVFAATVVGLQALVCVSVALYSLLSPSREASLSTTSHVMFTLLTLLFAAGLALVARGLWQGKAWPRMAAVVWLFLLLPVGWALLQAGQGVVGLLLLGSTAGGIVAIIAESRRAARV